MTKRKKVQYRADLMVVDELLGELTSAVADLRSAHGDVPLRDGIAYRPLQLAVEGILVRYTAYVDGMREELRGALPATAESERCSADGLLRLVNFAGDAGRVVGIVRRISLDALESICCRAIEVVRKCSQRPLPSNAGSGT